MKKENSSMLKFTLEYFFFFSLATLISKICPIFSTTTWFGIFMTISAFVSCNIEHKALIKKSSRIKVYLSDNAIWRSFLIFFIVMNIMPKDLSNCSIILYMIVFFCTALIATEYANLASAFFFKSFYLND